MGVLGCGQEFHHGRFDDIAGSEQLEIIHIPSGSDIGSKIAPFTDDESETHIGETGVIAEVERFFFEPSAVWFGQGVVGLPFAVGDMGEVQVSFVQGAVAKVGILGDGSPFVVASQPLLLVLDFAYIRR